MNKKVCGPVPRKEDPFELMQRLLAEESSGRYGPAPKAGDLREQPSDSVSTKAALRAKLRAKHGVGDSS